MAIKRHSCRVTERNRMKKLAREGLSVPQISNAVSVHEHVVTRVVSGEWAAEEKKGKAQQRLNDETRALAKENEEVNKAAAIAAATVRALRAVEADDVPQETKAEVAEISPQQKAANTRKRNRELEEDSAA